VAAISIFALLGNDRQQNVRLVVLRSGQRGASGVCRMITLAGEFMPVRAAAEKLTPIGHFMLSG
jgi:hypothetical protein